MPHNRDRDAWQEWERNCRYRPITRVHMSPGRVPWLSDGSNLDQFCRIVKSTNCDLEVSWCVPSQPKKSTFLRPPQQCRQPESHTKIFHIGVHARLKPILLCNFTAFHLNITACKQTAYRQQTSRYRLWTSKGFEHYGYHIFCTPPSNCICFQASTYSQHTPTSC
jgi:hypothetical protein